MSHPASGFYLDKDGKREYVSVSEILQQTSPVFDPGKHIALEKWREKEKNHEEIGANSRSRGHFLHAYIEEDLTGKEVKNKEAQLSMDKMISLAIPAYVANLGSVLEEIKRENQIDPSNYEECLRRAVELGFPLRLEKPIFCPYGWAGTPDAFLRWASLYTVWDWKTARSITEEGVEKKARSRSRYKDAGLQLSAYALSNNLKIHFGQPDRPKINQGAVCVCYDWREPQIHLFTAEQLAEQAVLFVERFEFYCEMHETSFPRIFQGNVESIVEEILV
jgi:hypothetical protein